MAAVGVAACSNDAGPPKDAYVDAAVGGGPMCASAFPSLKEFVQIGTATANHPTTVNDQGQDRGGSVSIGCRVTPQGGGFDIEATAVELGSQGGSLSISSPSGQGTVTTSGGHGVNATFATSAGGGGSAIVFSEQDGGCTITYTYDPSGGVGGVAGGAKVNINPPVAGGRIWGHVKCPNAKSQMPMDPTTVCDAEADFFFEHCDQ